MGPEDKAVVLEEQGGCSMCTSYTRKRNKCYQTKNGVSAKTCKEMEGNKVCGREHHPMLHLLKNSYCMAASLITSSMLGPTYREPSPSQAALGRPGRIRKSPTCLAALLNAPVRAVGGLQSSVGLMLEDIGATENLVMHAIAEKLKLAKVPTARLVGAAVGDPKQQQMYVYLLEFVNAKGVGHPIEAIGIMSITDIRQVEGMTALERLFPSAPLPARRPSGDPRASVPDDRDEEQRAALHGRAEPWKPEAV